jgi:DNA ligase-1
MSKIISTKKNSIEDFVKELVSKRSVPTADSDILNDNMANDKNTFIKPMLANAMKDINEIKNIVGRLTIEYKYDGQRVQVKYCKQNGFQIRSRSGKLISDRYLDVIDALNDIVKKHDVNSVILDGEIVPISSNGQFLRFQSLGKRNTLDYNVGSQHQVRLLLFDILELNGKSFINIPLRDRRDKLNNLINNNVGTIEMTKYTDLNDNINVMEIFKQALMDQCEGIMIKQLDGVYMPNKRTWYKYKKEYDVNLFDTIDLIPIGAQFGKGSRKGLFGSFLLACYNKTKNEYQTVCMVGTGFSIKLLEKLTDELMLNKTIDNTKLVNYNVAKSLVKKINVWFEPKHVWEVTGSDFSNSLDHTLKVGDKTISLRFPTFIRVRDDKDIEDATDADQMQEFYKKRMLHHENYT